MKQAITIWKYLHNREINVCQYVSVSVDQGRLLAIMSMFIQINCVRAFTYT